MNRDGRDGSAQSTAEAKRTSRFIDWYSEGEECVVETHGVRVAIRFVGRKGRRARIMITAPAGSTFTAGVAANDTCSGVE